MNPHAWKKIDGQFPPKADTWYEVSWNVIGYGVADPHFEVRTARCEKGKVKRSVWFGVDGYALQQPEYYRELSHFPKKRRELVTEEEIRGEL